VAKALGMRLQPLEANSPSEIDRAFAAMTRERADALLVLLDPIFARPRLREQIADLAARSHLPAVYALRLHVDAGGLMAYGANIFDLYRRTAIYVDKILKGAKPADLPVSNRRSSSSSSTSRRPRHWGSRSPSRSCIGQMR
jgi:putative ABC transport system substrate-binding protein